MHLFHSVWFSCLHLSSVTADSGIRLAACNFNLHV